LVNLVKFDTKLNASNEGKSAASFCCQLAAQVLDMFRNFYLVKNHKNAKNSTTSDVREKISADLESLEFQTFFDVGLTHRHLRI
jgi:hypothetical protein